MLRDIVLALDPSLIAGDVGMVLDPWQAELMRSTSPRVLLLAGRQCGKTEVVSVMAAGTAVTEPGSLILTCSPSQRQSVELARRIFAHMHTLGVEFASESVLRAELRNGSRVLALPADADTIRGFSRPSLVLLDEAARIDDDLYTSIRPMLATRPDARLIALSTPHGKVGWFHDAWFGDPSWHRVEVPASACPRISQAFLDEELRELGPDRFAEEYGLAWLEHTGSPFLLTDFDSCVDPDMVELAI